MGCEFSQQKDKRTDVCEKAANLIELFRTLTTIPWRCVINILQEQK